VAQAAGDAVVVVVGPVPDVALESPRGFVAASRVKSCDNSDLAFGKSTVLVYLGFRRRRAHFVFTDTDDKAGLAFRSVHVEAEEFQRGSYARFVLATICARAIGRRLAWIPQKPTAAAAPTVKAQWWPAD
jgi:hypothetical protein